MRPGVNCPKLSAGRGGQIVGPVRNQGNGNRITGSGCFHAACGLMLLRKEFTAKRWPVALDKPDENPYNMKMRFKFKFGECARMDGYLHTGSQLASGAAGIVITEVVMLNHWVTAAAEADSTPIPAVSLLSLEDRLND